jgi:hypothetical protein
VALQRFDNHRKTVKRLYLDEQLSSRKKSRLDDDAAVAPACD